MTLESILTALLNLGVGGIMAAAILYLVHHLVTKTIPKLIEDSKNAQKEEVKTLKEVHAQNQAIIDRMQTSYLTSLEKQQGTVDRLTQAVNSLCDQVRDISEQVSLLKGEAKTDTNIIIKGK